MLYNGNAMSYINQVTKKEGFQMNKLISIIGLFAVVSSLTTIANAKEHKPLLCQSFTETTLPVDGTPTKVAICVDGKKPQVLISYQIVSVKNADGATVKAAIGYR